jgi:hypothetical protein
MNLKAAAGASIAFLALCPQATYRFGGAEKTYVRVSASFTASGAEDYIECDTDSGNPITITLPPTPTPFEKHEVWLGPQPGLPGGTVTIDFNGQTSYGADLTLDSAMESRSLLWVKPTPSGGGYWLVRAL